LPARPSHRLRRDRHRAPEKVALRWKDGDDWKQWTFGEYADLVARAAGGLQARGVERGDRVVLMMRNTPSSTWPTWPR
jgi:acyl-coenzyme A synthetase/AMP-(fatty) acid ligase